jgi:hypothetical protein
LSGVVKFIVAIAEAIVVVAVKAIETIETVVAVETIETVVAAVAVEIITPVAAVTKSFLFLCLLKRRYFGHVEIHARISSSPNFSLSILAYLAKVRTLLEYRTMSN